MFCLWHTKAVPVHARQPIRRGDPATRQEYLREAQHSPGLRGDHGDLLVREHLHHAVDGTQHFVAEELGIIARALNGPAETARLRDARTDDLTWLIARCISNGP